MNTLQASQTNELIATREPFVVPVSLETNLIFCGDERFPLLDEDYIKWFGGILNMPYNYSVYQEATSPYSVNYTFEGSTVKFVPYTKGAGIKGGVHSDVASEQGRQFDAERSEGEVGCGYAGKRRGISDLIAQRGDEIIHDAQLVMPGLFQDSRDDEAAEAFVSAHKRLAKRDSFFTTGRGVVLKAVELGAPCMLVDGQHVSEDGIINTVPDTTIQTAEAFKAGKPTYVHDAGTLDKAFERLLDSFPHSRRLMKIGNTIDTIGTMRALGVKNIAAR